MYIDVLELSSAPGQAAEQAPPNFFFNRFFDMNEQSFEKLNPRESVVSELEESIERQKEETRDRLGSFNEEIIESVTDTVLTPVEASIRETSRELEQSPDVWLFENSSMEGPVIITDLSTGHRRHRRHHRFRSGRATVAVLLADQREFVRDFFDCLHTDIQQIRDMVGGFVEVESFNHGEDHVKNYFDEMVSEEYADSWYVEETDDEFEEEVYDTVKEQIGVCLPNLNVNLEIGENPEYDIVTLPLGKYGDPYAIEVKNYDREDIEEANDPIPDNLRYRLITQPREEAERVNLNLVTIVKGLSDEQYDDLQRHAGPSDVVLLKEDNYKKQIKEVLVDDSISELQSIVHE